VSECLLPLFSHFVTHRHNILSDHCIIEFSLISNVSLSHNASMETKTNHSKTFRYKWDPNKKDIFLESSDSFKSMLVD